MAKVFIGTSGYTYPHWENGVFYPIGWPRSKQLEYYSKFFDTVELNNPFYRLPESKTFKNWSRRVPENFIFTVKVSRFITHVKKLKNCKGPWQIFLKRSIQLGQKLGPFLFQFPPNWKKDKKRLEDFILLLQSLDRKYRYVFEFRHPSWFDQEIYQLLKKFKNFSLCLADSPRWPLVEIVTGNFIYIRMHGGKILYGSKYSDQELKSWAKKIKKYQNQGLDCYIYFNNDAFGFAIENAKTLKKMVK
jgi:uncharacterized protein YecE (DUF72 family)